MTRRANGEGSVSERKDGRWEGAAYVLLADGTYARRRVYGRTRQEASRRLTEIVSRSQAGLPADATEWTVERFLTYWLDQVVKPTRKPKTYEGYELVARVHLIPALGRKRLHRLTAADVRLFVKRLESAKPPPSTRLVQQVHAVLRNALQAAVREELIGRNVASLVQVASPSYDVNRGLTVAQARKLLAVSRNDRLHALYVLAVYLGLRRGELLGLQWRDVDLDAGLIEVRSSLQRVGGELRAVTPKTRSSRRTVPLIGLCGEALDEHRAAQNAERAAAGLAWLDTGYVFTTGAGTPIEPANLRRSWYPLRDAAGLGPVRLHDLRHTCVSLLLDLGAPPHAVREIVGHADLSVTMMIYAHASQEDKRTALGRLDDRLR
jgi:integrase